jgi:hypothetical protein
MPYVSTPRESPLAIPCTILGFSVEFSNYLVRLQLHLNPKKVCIIVPEQSSGNTNVIDSLLSMFEVLQPLLCTRSSATRIERKLQTGATSN